MCRSLWHPTHHLPKDDLLDPDEKTLYDHITLEYRQEVDRLKWALALANARLAVQGTLISTLETKLKDPPPAPAVPNPGPPPAR